MLVGATHMDQELNHSIDYDRLNTFKGSRRTDSLVALRKNPDGKSKLQEVPFFGLQNECGALCP
jgi:hypothetical protein